MTITSDSPPQTPPAKSRSGWTDAKRDNRRQWRARVREANRESECLARYDELKDAMKRAGLRIGSLSDLAEVPDPAHRLNVLQARVQRWDAQWTETLRKRDTRAKIVVGGAVLAEFRDNPELADRLLRCLDQRVLRPRDRALIRTLLGDDRLTIRKGGHPDEDLATALTRLGEQLIDYETLIAETDEPSADSLDVAEEDA
jgi:hypothetical protein